MDLNRAFNDAAGLPDPRDAKSRRMWTHATASIVATTASLRSLAEITRQVDAAFVRLAEVLLEHYRPKWGPFNWLYRFFVYISNL